MGYNAMKHKVLITLGALEACLRAEGFGCRWRGGDAALAAWTDDATSVRASRWHAHCDALGRTAGACGMTAPATSSAMAPTPPDPRWPGGARVAVQFVVNYEEGAENSVLNGDAGSEAFLSEMVGAASHPARAMAMESLYEYGSRAGFWRLHRLFIAAQVCRSPCSASPRRWR